jgi:hypothetical protein
LDFRLTAFSEVGLRYLLISLHGLPFARVDAEVKARLF